MNQTKDKSLESSVKTKKGFIAKLLERLDQKLETKAKQAPCCDKSGKKKGSGCC